MKALHSLECISPKESRNRAQTEDWYTENRVLCVSGFDVMIRHSTHQERAVWGHESVAQVFWMHFEGVGDALTNHYAPGLQQGPSVNGMIGLPVLRAVLTFTANMRLLAYDHRLQRCDDVSAQAGQTSPMTYRRDRGGIGGLARRPSLLDSRASPCGRRDPTRANL